MGFWDDIGDAFKSVGDAIVNVANDAVNGVEKGFDWTKTLVESGALKVAIAVADGAALFSHGWQQVFSGHFQQGLSDVVMGMAEASGIIPGNAPPGTPIPNAHAYEQALGDSSLWSLQESHRRNNQVCFSEHLAKVKQNFANLKLHWADSMEKPVREGVQKLMPWINLNC
jgi:hypothetical protein